MALVEGTLARLSYYHEIVQMVVIFFVKGRLLSFVTVTSEKNCWDCQIPILGCSREATKLATRSMTDASIRGSVLIF